jgi:hypothetical protein
MGIGVSGFERITPIFHHSTTPIRLRFDAVTFRLLAGHEMIAA